MVTSSDLPAIENYNPLWADLYSQEESLLKESLGSDIVDIQHIGSTAVPGLAAKPIIDIQIAVDNLEDAAKLLPKLEAAGYVPSPNATSLFLCKTNTHRFHLYIDANKSELTRRIIFRDYLRANPRGAQEYEALKKAMADKFADDPSVYVDAKTAFITLALCMYDQPTSS